MVMPNRAGRVTHRLVPALAQLGAGQGVGNSVLVARVDQASGASSLTPDVAAADCTLQRVSGMAGMLCFTSWLIRMPPFLQRGARVPSWMKSASLDQTR